ncbi:UvrD/REP helicase [Candidatus Ruthia magnifica str. Cm (Calyptogena magnifica)]|uniref:DNA 3'-5' helicase n=1 Tax=Ruthia magnifica subsp. Calyptogena magnifica TaxID=413404 RepID=A1AVC3_RUTMC|nr:UvrD-helicase domain-containing protein [Candidatus Ruthturnera calyptogenae]ABL01880.1 UvrD/REP helicase [Candidatus Ruthia magnifica str. Cm (Calyptogena magnifica)]
MNDQTQRRQALDVSQSFIVQAPAGSGKTELLTQRYLKLLSVSASPESVIAMTFTKKAVSELTTRVIESLKLAQGNRPKESYKQTTYDLALKVLEKSKTLDWQLLNMYERFKILTIDGLSGLIASRYPSKNQLVPKQIIAQNCVRNDIYLKAAKQTLLAIDESEYQNSIESVLLYLDNNVNKFYRLIIDMLAKRDQWLLKLYQHGVLNIETLRLSSKKIIIQHLLLLKNEVERYFNVTFFKLLKDNTKPEFAQIQGVPDATVESLEVWKNLCQLCLTTQGKWRTSLNKNNGFPVELKTQKQAVIKIFQDLSSHQQLRKLLAGVEQLPDVNFSTNQINILQDIAQVLKLAVIQLNILFDVNQTYDFIQVALDANQALDEHQVGDVALFLDNKVQHILIDEFQDTSATQFVLLEKLIINWQVGDGKTLFLVGDPMQSIYLFRQSQVGLFLQVRVQGIANIKPKFLQLSTNFRSSESVVEGNNKIFSKIFPQQEDAFKGAIKYEHSQANFVDENENAIRFYPFAYKRYDFEAQKVLEIIQNNPTKEIVILVRSRSHLDDIVSILKRANIEFEALKILPLKEDLFTRDLLSLTRALKHLGDKLAWLAILRAPWCGLLLEDLLVLSQQDERVIFDLIQDEQVLQGLSENGQLRIRNFVHVFCDIVNQQSRFSFTKVLAFAINQLAPQSSLSVKRSMIKIQFLQIIHDCESVQQLDIETINQMLDGLYAPSVNARIKLMTIHEAKGLEFELVIIPGLGRMPQNNIPSIIHLQEFSNQSLLLAPIRSYTQLDDSHTYTYLKHIKSQQNKFETMRLLYVAMTRAKLEIHLLGTLNQSNQASSNTFLKLLAPIFQHQFDKLKLSTTEDNQPLVQAPEFVRYIKPLEYDNLPDESKKKMDFQLSVDLQYKSLLGTLLHQYYEDSLFSPDKQSIRARLMECGVGNMDIDSHINFIVNMLNLTKQDKHFSWLFKQRTSTQVEVEFINDKHSVIIDRLFIDEDTLWIIDFKTATKSNNESIAQFIQRQKIKYTQQLLSYKVALSEYYSMEIKCALYCSSVQELIEIY